jgi:beta-lactam-binding protein with PASTA domain
MTPRSDDQTILETPPPTEALAAATTTGMRRLFPITLALLLLALTTWSGYVFCLTIYRDYLYVPGEKVVPKVTGLEIKQAYEAIEKEGLKLQVHESRYDKKIPKRVVLHQNPPAGRSVREGRTVLVAVSLGPELMQVPKLEGESLRSAKIALSNAKLQLGTVTFEDGVYGEDEAVTKQNPGPGKMVQRGQAVHLTVRRAYR